MKKFAFCFALVLLFTSSSFANITPADVNVVSNNVVLHTIVGGHGPFKVYMDGSYIFNTFCVEKSITFTPGDTYIASIDEKVYFAPGGEPSGSILNDAVKKLYAAYLNNSFTTSQHEELQNTIWNLQNFSVTVSDALFTSILADPVNFDYYGNSLNINGWQNVKVLNLWKSDGHGGLTDCQSQLIMVPAPGAIILCGLGTLITAKIRRRTL